MLVIIKSLEKCHVTLEYCPLFASWNTASEQVENVFISLYLDVANCWNFGILKPLIHLFDIDEKMNADWHGWETFVLI